MLKKKGFTLIELLAVVVILALLALITAPNVLNLIENTRKSAAEENARVIASAAENYYAQHTLLHNERVGEIDLTSDILNYKGDKPYKGYVYFDDDGNAYIKMYQNGYCVINDYDNTAEAQKMEAKECEIKSLIIFIDLDGGKLEDTKLEFEQGDTFGELPTPTKDGYTFIGWFDKIGNEITPDTIIDTSGTIYAKWEANTYTITLSLPEGNIPVIDGWDVINGTPTKKIVFDTEYGLLPEPSKTGYTFVGWYTTGGIKIIPTTILTIPNDHVLTGIFTANKYEITYVYNNGNENTKEIVTYDNNYNLPTVTRGGYEFLGWYDGDNKIENNSVIKILSDKTYEAKWQANTYTVTFIYNNEVTANTTKEVTYDSTYGELPLPTKVGYEFLGWYDNNTLITKDTKVSILEEQILEAKWKANIYEVTFKYNDNVTEDTVVNVTYDANYTLPNPSRTGYTFKGWYLGSTKIENDSIVKITSNENLEALWEANKYEVTFVYNNGMANTFKDVLYDSAYGELPIPEKTGYIFQGWFTTGGVTITNDTKVTMTSNHTLNALWSASGYTLTYNANGGTVTPGTASVTYDSTYGTLPTPSRTGYLFIGWFTASTGGTEVTASTKVQTAGNHSIYAQWNPITYTVAYNANGGSGTMSSITHTYDTAKTLTANTFTRTGYTFKNWNTVKGGTGTSYANSASVKNLSSTSGATVTLYAQWTANTYTVAYNANDGSGTMTSVTHTYDTAKTLTANTFTRTGYTFKNWNTVKGGTGTSYANSASVKNLTSTKGATVTLYAQWTANTYTVAYNANGGSGTMTSVTHTYDTAKTLTANTFTRTGYTFAGWNTKSDGSGTSYANSASVKNLSSTKDATVTLFAKWTVNSGTIYYYPNGGTATSSYPLLTSGTYSGASSGTSTYKYTDTAKDLYNVGTLFTRTGYHVVSDAQAWRVNSSTATTYINQASQNMSSYATTNGTVVKLYANWAINTYKVAYNANGGSGTMSTVTHTYNTAKNLTTNTFTRTNYIFKGWNTKADGTGTSYADGASVKNLTGTHNATVTLYAQWTPIYTISSNKTCATYTANYPNSTSTYTTMYIPTNCSGGVVTLRINTPVKVGDTIKVTWSASRSGQYYFSLMDNQHINKDDSPAGSYCDPLCTTQYFKYMLQSTSRTTKTVTAIYNKDYYELRLNGDHASYYAYVYIYDVTINGVKVF